MIARNLYFYTISKMFLSRKMQFSFDKIYSKTCAKKKTKTVTRSSHGSK